LKYDFEKIERLKLNKKLINEQITRNNRLNTRGDLPFPFRQIANIMFPIQGKIDLLLST
jgi:hypothetical protein